MDVGGSDNRVVRARGGLRTGWMLGEGLRTGWMLEEGLRPRWMELEGG